MFYLKHRGEKLEIQCDNVYTVCPQCQREIPVDIAEVLAEGDLEGTQVYCVECSKRPVKNC